MEVILWDFHQDLHEIYFSQVFWIQEGHCIANLVYGMLYSCNRVGLVFEDRKEWRNADFEILVPSLKCMVD